MKFFGDKTPEKRLAHALKKYAKLADSDSFRLLSHLPKQEYWRFFIDGIYQKSTRQIIIKLNYNALSILTILI